MPELRSLAQPNSRFAGDDGAPDRVTRAAIAGARDHVGYTRALVALCTSRLLLPIVASGDEGGDAPDPNRHAEMAAVTLTDDGVTHLLAFTGLDALQAWDASARPVPCLLDELCGTVAAAGATRLLLDVAGPVPFVIAGEALDLLAAGNALVEFEGADFAWVRFTGDDSEPPASITD